MNSIHSSSLTYNTSAAYNKTQPRLATTIENVQSTSDNNPGKHNTANSGQTTLAATPGQIQSSLSAIGWEPNDSSNQPYSRGQKAVNTYTQTYRQALQLNVSETIAGIDVYA